MNGTEIGFAIACLAVVIGAVPAILELRQCAKRDREWRERHTIPNEQAKRRAMWAKIVRKM